jgi:hypothetical protein
MMRDRCDLDKGTYCRYNIYFSTSWVIVEADTKMYRKR